MKTIQLRRYQIIDGLYEEFLDWWKEAMPAVRTQSGFAIEFAYGLPESNEFLWAVSVPGDVAEFERRVESYRQNEDRIRVFTDLPDRVSNIETQFIDIAADAGAPAHRSQLG